MPATVLVTVVPEYPDGLEAHGLVQADASLVRQGDAGEQRHIAEIRDLGYQTFIKQTPQTPRPVLRAKVDRAIRRSAIRGPLPV